MQRFSYSERFTLPAIYRPPPTGDQRYAPYVHPSTAELVEKYAVPVIEEVMNELVVLGSYHPWFPQHTSHSRPTGKALGFNEEEGTPKTIISSVRNLHSRPESKHVPSMLLDAQNGLPIEVEVILGEVVRLAKQHNVSVPVSRSHTVKMRSLSRHSARRNVVRPAFNRTESNYSSTRRSFNLKNKHLKHAI